MQGNNYVSSSTDDVNDIDARKVTRQSQPEGKYSSFNFQPAGYKW